MYRTFRENMKKTTQLFRDRPMSAIDTAVFWVEYAYRHKNILQSPAIHLTWWQQKLLDVYGFLFACLATVLFIVILVVRKLMRLFLGCKSCSKDSKTSESKKRKWKCSRTLRPDRPALCATGDVKNNRQGVQRSSWKSSWWDFLIDSLKENNNHENLSIFMVASVTTCEWCFLVPILVSRSTNAFARKL